MNLWQRIQLLFGKRRFERELDDELRFHLDAQIQANRRAGMSPEEARRQAMLELGGMEQVKEQVRHGRPGFWLETLWQDVRFGARMLRKNPGFTAVAMLTLALGIGANTAVFSLLDAALLKTLPVREPERLVLLDWIAGPNIDMIRSLDGTYITNDEGQGWSTSFSVPAFREIQQQNRVFESTFAFAELDRVNVRLGGEAEIAYGQQVSGDYFAGLGLAPQAGRLLTPADDRPEADPAAVISFAYWQRRFGKDPSAIGQTLFLNGSAFTIVGVTPPGFEGTLQVGDSPDITIPLSLDDRVQSEKGRLADEANWWVRIFGRLKPEVTPEQAHADLSILFQRIATRNMPAGAKWDIPQLRVHSGRQGLTERRERYSNTLFLLQGGVALLLLIACANVAALLLVQSDKRRKEMAVRIALGAGRFRLLRQMLVESALLSVLGGGAGWLLAVWGKSLVGAALPSSGFVPAPLAVLDWRVFAFTAVVALTTGILCGLAPAFRRLRDEVAPALKETSRAAPRSLLLGQGLLVLLIALSVILLTGAGLLGRTLAKLHAVDYGFDASHILLARVDPTLNGYEGERLANLYGGILERLRGLPGVEHASLTRFPLVSGRVWAAGVDVPGYTPPSGETPRVLVSLVSEDYLETMRIPLLAGRPLSAQDTEQAQPVAVISQATARQYFQDPAPLGRRFTFGRRELEVVGVAADTAYLSLRSEVRPSIYVPYRQYQSLLGGSYFAVRTRGVPEQMAPALRQVVRSADPNLPIFDVKTQEEQLEESLSSETRLAGLAATFGGLALVLVCVGLAGLLSYEVRKRTREIGIRVALGAHPGDVFGLVIGQGLRLVLIGAVLGLTGAAFLTRLLKDQLHGVQPTDPATFASVALVLALVAVAACYLPARRATRVDPMVALRYE